ncbi:MAG: arabinosyltransferase, partial [Pseudonocardia sediminis]
MTRAADRWLAAVLGIVSALLALAVPFLPVTQDTAEVRWPSAATGTAPVDVPLVALRPAALQATFGCAGIRSLDARTAGEATLFSTVPVTAPDGGAVGMRVRVADGTLTVDARGRRLATAGLPAGDCTLTSASDPTAPTASLGDRPLFSLAGDQRPQVVGVHSDLDAARDPVGPTAV